MAGLDFYNDKRHSSILTVTIAIMSGIRSVATRLVVSASKILTTPRRSYHYLTHHGETDEETDKRYEAYFNRTDIDGWDVRQAMTDILGMDLVPQPKIIIAAMYACRRVNDYALAVRFLEAVKDKTGPKCCEIYPYLIEEIAPVICELGVDTPEMLGFDKPECYVESVYNIH